MKIVINYELALHSSLCLEEVWPDGDAPENPTEKDVLDLIEKSGGIRKVIKDWSLMNDSYVDTYEVLIIK